VKFKQIFIPDQQNHVFEMPKEFYGKKVEVSVVELSSQDDVHPLPPIGRKVAVEELFETFGAASDFPTADELRSRF
jgi:hypothetical protein